MFGATNPLVSAPGTIRGDFCIQTHRNIFYGSDSVGKERLHIGLRPGKEMSISLQNAAILVAKILYGSRRTFMYRMGML
ncbi:unnamed protein product [Angiostrongylus costaricensis]|uniref:NDK domain-containing protein n=1 Tax=Angiostrongylus costaricensis TaxID=334426 RepID=A0A0R3PKQ6_ANGCS|nr:unnamed protein product [Angiostrongylus costaricensis]